jgi:hypothetical protein
LTVLFFFYSFLTSRYIYFARIHLQKIFIQLLSNQLTLSLVNRCLRQKLGSEKDMIKIKGKYFT